MKVLMSATLLLSALTFVLCLAAVLLVVKTKPARATLLETVRSSIGKPPHPVGGTVSPYHNNDSWRWIQ